MTSSGLPTLICTSILPPAFSRAVDTMLANATDSRWLAEVLSSRGLPTCSHFEYSDASLASTGVPVGPVTVQKRPGMLLICTTP